MLQVYGASRAGNKNQSRGYKHGRVKDQKLKILKFISSRYAKSLLGRFAVRKEREIEEREFVRKVRVHRFMHTRNSGRKSPLLFDQEIEKEAKANKKLPRLSTTTATVAAVNHNRHNHRRLLLALSNPTPLPWRPSITTATVLASTCLDIWPDSFLYLCI